MNVRFSEDVIPLTDLKTNPGRVVRQVADTRRRQCCSPAADEALPSCNSIADYEAAEEEREFMRAVVQGVQGLADLEADREVSMREVRARLRIE